MGEIKIKRALISVWDKTGIVEFARALHGEFSVEIISTGGTAKTLREAGVPVTLIEDITGFPEMLDGRVKTLHPAIHAGILADRDNPEHMRQLAAAGIKPIDMVVVNLYPFERTVAEPGCTFEQAIEMIDIGGVTLLRAAAKNHKDVVVLSHADMYSTKLKMLALPHVRQELATHAIWVTAGYDAAISAYLTRRPDSVRFCGHHTIRLAAPTQLRYGENPHLAAAGYKWAKFYEGDYEQTVRMGGLNLFRRKLKDGGGLSFSNFLDADAALGLCSELGRLARSAKLCFAASESDQPCANLTPTSEANQRFAVQRQDAEAQAAPRSAKLRFAPITQETAHRRNLPHWQVPGATYWITFSSRIGVLAPGERDIAMNSLRFWDGKKLDLHAAVVMPDHVHALLTPRLIGENPPAYENLSKLLKSIKGFSGREISKHRDGIGEAWVHESYDHWIRDEEDLRQKWNYIAENVVKEGLAATPDEYRWWWAVDFWNSGWGEPVTPQTAIPAVFSGSGERPGKEGKAELRSTGEAGSKAELCTTPVSVCAYIKHNNPCGVGIAHDPVEAYRRAYLGDPNAAMGGILAVNFDVKAGFAEVVMDSLARWGKQAGAGAFFVEVWVAPAFDEEAVKVIRGTSERGRKKKWGENVRLLAVGDMSQPPDPAELQYRSIAGGMLVQTPDLAGLNEEQWKVVTKRPPTDAEMADLRLAWLICKHTKSNAISIVKDGMLLGNGAGQMSRVMSCRIATWLAKENGHIGQGNGAECDRGGSTQGVEESAYSEPESGPMRVGPVAASDAFFPFADGPRILIDAGVTALIQPGGSKRDEDTIKLCDERGVAMIFTGTRHFRH